MDDLSLLLGSEADGGGAKAGLDDLTQLVHATLNEKNAPDVLPFRTDLVRRVEAALKSQEEYCEQLEPDMQQELKRMMLSLEVRRVRYLVKQYYRTRLHKIEKYAATIMDNPAMHDRLSAAELQFCHDYFCLVGNHLTDTVLKHMPPDFAPLAEVRRGGEGRDLIPQPMLDSHVFCKLLEDVGPVDLEEGQSVDMHADDLFMLRYRVVAHLVEGGQAVLT